MAVLYFRISSDWEQVVKLRDEIKKLENQLKSFGKSTPETQIRQTEERLATTRQEFMKLTTEAAKAGAAMEHDFKNGIYNASQTVNNLSANIISQRSVIRQLQNELTLLKEKYRETVKSGGDTTGMSEQIKAQTAKLREQKDVLFGLTQQQAEARLSVKRLRDEYTLYKQEAGKTVGTNEGLSVSWKKMLGVIGGATALKSLASQVIRVRGEFQSMQTAIETMVGKDVASGLMSQLKEMAKISPLTLTDMVDAEKMMLGFNIQAEDTVRYLQALSDISMGDSVKFKSLTLAFSQMSAAGKLMGQDLNQMINAGFNPLQIISEKTGKSISTLKDEMSKGAVSAEMVQQAFIDATSAGGKFYQMSENASKTINGQLSMMQDALDNAFNEMGQASEGVIMKGIQLTTTLIQNYETVGKVLVGLVATYGAYRTAVMLATIATSKHTIAEVALANAKMLARRAQMLLNAAMLTNPYVALATVIAGLVTTMWAFHDSTSQTEEAAKRLNKAVSSVEGQASKEISALKSLNKQLNETEKGTEKWNKIKNQIIEGYSKYLPGIEQEIEKTGNLAEKYNELEAAIRKAAAARSFNEIEQNENTKYQEIRNKNLESAYNAFMERYGDKNGLYVYKRWLSYLDSGTDIPAEAQRIFSNTITGWNESANSLLFEIRKQDELRKQNLQKYKNIFGITDEDINSEETAKTGTDTRTTDRTSANLTDKEKKEAENRIKIQQKLADEILQLRRKNQGQETALMKEGTKKKLEQINDDYEAQKAEIEKKARELAELNRKSGISGTNANGLTAEQQAEIDRANKLNDESRNKQSDEVYKAEREAMRNYLQEYGTFQQQKLAIAQEYADKIAKAQSEGERMALEKRRDAAIAQVNTNALKMDIDWATAFSGLDGVFSEVIKPVLDKVKEYARTEEFRGLDASDQQSVIEAISRMEESVGGLGKVKFSDLGKQVDTLRQNVLDLNSAKEEEAEAVEKLKKAQEDYEKALKDGTQEQIDISKLALDDAQNKADAASKNVENQQNIVRNSSNQLNSTVTTLDAKLKNVTQGFQQLSSGGLSNLYQGITKLVKGFGGTAEKLGDVEFIGAIFSALDALKEGISPIVEDVIGNVFGVLNNTVSDIFSGDIFVSLFDSLRDGIGGFWDAITFGGFSSWTDGNSKEVQATIDRLTSRNEALQQSIDDLNDTMKQAKGTQTVEASKRAEEYQREVNQNYLEMAMAQAGYHNSHHSWNYYWGGFTQEMIDKLSEQIGRNWDGSLWNLSPEEMKILRSNPDMWSLIQNTGEGGYGNRLAEKLDDYIDQAGKLDEITNNTYELLTQISFDSMYDSFIDNLMDMEYSAKDAADDISEYFMRAMLANQIGDLYADKLKKWWEQFGMSMEDDGELDEDEIRNLRDEYMNYVNEALNLRDQLAAATGYDKISEEAKEQQSATSKGFETMTQDQASELSGRFTAVAESNMRIEEATDQQTLAITQLSGSISVLTSQIYGSHNIAEDARNILAQSYLELQQINENTGNSAKYLKDIKADIAIVKQNTSRL